MSYEGWVCCWFSLCSEGFSGFSGFPPSRKTNIFKFQFGQDRGPARKPGWCGFSSKCSILIYVALIFGVNFVSSSSPVYHNFLQPFGKCDSSGTWKHTSQFFFFQVCCSDLIFHSCNPNIKFASTHLYTWVEKDTRNTLWELRVFPKPNWSAA